MQSCSSVPAWLFLYGKFLFVYLSISKYIAVARTEQCNLARLYLAFLIWKVFVCLSFNKQLHCSSKDRTMQSCSSVPGFSYMESFCLFIFQ